ncbi:hypothetical protein EsDP_00006428 [Epichloe bromicola]|uniref:Chromo domain-containing protein n=1 Tax=Epichloe bromicola TaxID=79588 RepID=A0ABQ0CXK9_9HYPO
MSSILASIFSPRKAAIDGNVASSSPLGPDPATSANKLKRKSLPGIKRRRSVKFVGSPIRDSASQPTTETTSPAESESPANLASDEGAAVPQDSAEEAAAAVVDGSPGDAPNETETEETEYAFEKFARHRWAGNSIEIQVEWQDGDATWEQEAVLHQDAPDALLEYWESQGGRPTNPDDPDLFDIHAIRRHSKDRKKLLVEWVGYGPKEATWVPRASVEETAPEVVAQYWESVKSAKPRQRRRRR